MKEFKTKQEERLFGGKFNEDKTNVMEGKSGWFNFMAWNHVKLYSNGKEIRDQFGEIINI